MHCIVAATITQRSICVPSCSTWKLALRLIVYIGHFVNLIPFHSKAFPIFLWTKTHECLIPLMWHTHKPVSLNWSQVTGMKEADGLDRGMLASELRCRIYPQCYLWASHQNGLLHCRVEWIEACVPLFGTLFFIVRICAYIRDRAKILNTRQLCVSNLCH